MSTWRRIFYVVYLGDERLQGILNTMRFIADPDEKFCAHITIRGPYPQKYDLRAMDRKVRGAEVVADGVGSFFDADQNTVFIKCRSDLLRHVWRKPDYGFNPHITIYDGSSRAFAEVLLDRLDHLELRFSFSVGPLLPLVSLKNQQSMELSQSFNEALMADVVGSHVGASEVHTLSVDQRVSLIELFARKLAEAASFQETPI